MGTTAKKKATNKFSPEVRERAVRMVRDHQGDHSLAMGGDCGDRREDRLHGREPAAVGCGRLSATRGVRPRPDDGCTGADQSAGAGKPRACVRRTKFCARRRLKFCAGGARPPVQAMIAFIDDHRAAHGVEPICAVLPIAPSTYRAHAGDAPRSREGLGAGAVRCGFARENPARL